MLTLTNSFHGSECKVRLTEKEMDSVEYDYMCGRGEDEKRAKRVIHRVWKKLCGIKGCTCGDIWGRRG